MTKELKIRIEIPWSDSLISCIYIYIRQDRNTIRRCTKYRWSRTFFSSHPLTNWQEHKRGYIPLCVKQPNCLLNVDYVSTTIVTQTKVNDVIQIMIASTWALSSVIENQNSGPILAEYLACLDLSSSDCISNNDEHRFPILINFRLYFHIFLHLMYKLSEAEVWVAGRSSANVNCTLKG